MKTFPFPVYRFPLAVLLIAAVVVFAACNRDGDGEPAPTEPVVQLSLTVSPASITAPAPGTYTYINVTSNTTWTATVNPADWCSPSRIDGIGDSTVAVYVSANSDPDPRAATITITATGTLTAYVAVKQDAMPVAVAKTSDPDAPTQAVSDTVWRFGGSTLTWSDAIHIPECDDTLFAIHPEWTKPACRSYRSSVGDTVYFYYNWPYVDQHAAALCPSPWRVPTRADFQALCANAKPVLLIDEWGFGGNVWGEPSGKNNIYLGTEALYWSATPDNIRSLAWALKYYKTDVHGAPSFAEVDFFGKNYGYQVRCVK
jgi:hypothetical protein